MGLFDKKLDYSDGNGALPWLNESEYSTLRLPSSTELSAPNLKLSEKEKKQNKFGHFLNLVLENYKVIEYQPEVIKLTEKYLSTLVRLMAPKVLDVNSDAFQSIGRYLTVGISFANVELESTLQISGKIHPSVSNAIFSLWLDISSDNILRDLFKDVENYDHVLQLAIKIGYIAQRYEGKLSVQEMFTNIRPLS
jgi:hypothetical protein